MNLNEAGVGGRQFLDKVNAANLVGLSLRHFRRIIKDKHIRRIKIGRRFFVINADLQRWKAERRMLRLNLTTPISREIPD